jgi:N-acetyl-gamma-glutamyl-phosphate reductase
MSLPVGVVGFRGYSGAEAVRILSKHPQCEPVLLEHRVDAGADAGLLKKSVVRRAPATADAVSAHGLKAVLLATPPDVSMDLTPDFLDAGAIVVDLSGAFRLRTPERYKQWYKEEHTAPGLFGQAAYGLPEYCRDRVRNARLISNPGCYPTAANLAIRPLLEAGAIDRKSGIVCDAKSGVSGAGKAATAKTHFMYAADNLSAYAVFGHRHTGEMLEQLGLTAEQIQFTPHLLPIPRGILSTIYVRLAQRMQPEQIEACLRGFYAASPMVRVHATPGLPQIQHVVRTNYIDLGFELAKDGRRLVVVSCLDNLLKGAAGQAVQNMNVMCGWDEAEGLL